MGEPPGGDGLLKEPPLQCRVRLVRADGVQAENLHGDHAAELVVPGLVDDARGSPAQLGEDLVATELQIERISHFGVPDAVHGRSTRSA